MDKPKDPGPLVRRWLEDEEALSSFDRKAPACDTCRHKIPGKRQCAAFPDGIPGEIWFGDHDHHTPYPGDHGIQYEPREDASKE